MRIGKDICDTFPPSTAALGRTQQTVLCSLPLHPLPTHRIRIKIRTPHPSIPVHATREAVISATEPLPMPAMGDTGGGYMRSGRAVESPTTGASVSSPGHSVQTKYAGTPYPSLSVVLCMRPRILQRFLQTSFNPLHSYPPNFFH